MSEPPEDTIRRALLRTIPARAGQFCSGNYETRDDALAALDVLLAERQQRDQRDEWLLKQLDGCIEDAETMALTTGLALARAVAGNLRDARAALAVLRDPSQDREIISNSGSPSPAAAVGEPAPPPAKHMRFVAGTIYCPVETRRFQLGYEHTYREAFVCPGCGENVPARPAPAESGEAT